MKKDQSYTILLDYCEIFAKLDEVFYFSDLYFKQYF